MNTNGFASTAPDLQADPSGAHILVVDDNQDMQRLLSLALTRAGYQVLTAGDGPQALEQFRNQRIDLVLLDVNLPGMDGYTLCIELRKRTMAPILFLLATCAPLGERVMGIELGADGYLTKPFTLQELCARVYALLTRVSKTSQATAPPSLRIGAIRLDEWAQLVTVCGRSHPVTPQEFKLLRYLMRHPDRRVAKEELRAIIWPAEQGTTPEDEFNRLRVMVYRLRQKIEEDPAHPRYLKTVPGVGYQFCSASPA
jgi:DNA-binding response OmpR family regulator